MLSKEKAVEYVIDALKKEENLPFQINTARCPKRSRTCQKRHGDYFILKYNSETSKFLIRSYGVHSEVSSESTFSESQLAGALLYCLKKKKFTLPTLLKMIDITDYYKTHRLILGFSDEQWKVIREMAGHTKTTEWAVKKLLS
tara:strand:+ start:31 stop:459 length:429 start_codon:yes stop_codon:yes gene_type:complete